MGLTSVQSDQCFQASRVHVILNGSPVDVRVEVADTVREGQIHVRSDVKRLSGMNLSYSTNDGLLTIEVGSQSTGRIVARNTGNAVATGGGIANTGVSIGGGGRKASDPRKFTPVHSAGMNQINKVSSPKATLTLSVGPRGLQYLLER